jgi:hypothetical protein
MQRIYFILAVVGWIWLVVAGLAVGFMLWRKSRKSEQRGFEVTPEHKRASE